MPDMRWLQEFLLENRRQYEAGKANLIDWVGITGKEIILIKFKELKP